MDADMVEAANVVDGLGEVGDDEDRRREVVGVDGEEQIVCESINLKEENIRKSSDDQEKSRMDEGKSLEEGEARRVFRQIATAVYYCHKVGVNIFLEAKLLCEPVFLYSLTPSIWIFFRISFKMIYKYIY